MMLRHPYISLNGLVPLYRDSENKFRTYDENMKKIVMKIISFQTHLLYVKVTYNTLSESLNMYNLTINILEISTLINESGI